VVDVAPIDGHGPWSAFTSVREELEGYGAGLRSRPFCVVLSKVDLLPEHELPALAEDWRARLDSERNVCREQGAPLVVATSSATGAGIEELGRAIFAHTAAVPSGEPIRPDEQIAEHVTYRPGDASAYRVERTGEHLFRIAGRAIEGLVRRHDLENSEALEYIEERLRAMGVVKGLESKGFEPGDEIEIDDVAFALYPGVPQPD
jgi:GTP-binding protein